MPYQEAAWGTIILKKVEAINTVDPNHLFNCQYCVGYAQGDGGGGGDGGGDGGYGGDGGGDGGDGGDGGVGGDGGDDETSSATSSASVSSRNLASGILMGIVTFITAIV